MRSEIQDRLGFTPIRWEKDHLTILDQRLLPGREEYRQLKTFGEVVDAIADMSIRGAPLIGIAAAYALCLLENPNNDDAFLPAYHALRAARPTAVNLAWALDLMMVKRNLNLLDRNLRAILIEEALKIHREDAAMCAKIGQIGCDILPNECRILTHCNAGALATGGIGTALGVIYTAHFSGKKVEVWVDETRPVLQGARLTAWELSRAGVPYTLICDNMPASLMAQGKIDLVITGADRVAANLDFANKIGTYALAVLAKYHSLPFYAAAPSSTIDHACPNGASIIIENRSSMELLEITGHQIAPSHSPAYNPAFDVTPHELVTGIITENGVLRP